MANYMAEVARLLGVELGEEFKCNETSYTYTITEYGAKCSGCFASESLAMLLNGALTVKHKPYKPKMDEWYWVIKPDGDTGYMRWCGEVADISFYKLGNCYHNMGAAQMDRKKWVEFYASDEVLEV